MVEPKRKSRGGDANVGEVKRQRVSRACDQCRAAREKCDGIQPMCFTCASCKRECSYTTNPKRRGIQPGYIRTLELTLAWALANVSGCEESLVGLLQDEKGQLLISGTDIPASNKLHRRWRKNIVCKAIDRVLSGESIDDLFEQATTTSGDEEDEEDEVQSAPVRHSIMTPESLKAGFAPFDVDIPQADEAVPHDANLTHVIEMPQTNPIQGTAKTLHLPANYWRLIDVYFAYTHSWLPIASKENILKLCYSYPPDGLEIQSNHEAGEHAELWSILALAAVQDGSTEQGSDNLCSVQSILATAENFISPVLEELEVGHISALLTLSLVNIAVQKFQLAWLLLGRAIRGATFVHTRGSAQDAIALFGSRARLHCILLGCFVVDTVLCAQLNTVPSLRSDHAIFLSLIPEEGLDEWQPWSGLDGFRPSTIAQSKRPTLPSLTKSIFNQLVKLCYILNDRIVGRLMRKQAAGNIGSQWLNSLPTSLGPLHGLSPEQTTPQKIHLFMTYLVGRVLVTDGQLSTIEESLTVFDHFTYTLGAAAMPPLFSCFLHILKEKTQSNGFQHNRLAGILTRFATIWKLPQTGTRAASKTPAHHSTHSITLNYHHQDELNDHITPRPPPSSTSAIIVPQSPLDLQQPSPLLMRQPTISDLSAPSNTAQPLYEAKYLTRYNSGGSMDLDALFDDFTAFDAAEPGLNPQFMQNLGYAPNANLAELMTSDFGWGFKPG